MYQDLIHKEMFVIKARESSGGSSDSSSSLTAERREKET